MATKAVLPTIKQRKKEIAKLAKVVPSPARSKNPSKRAGKQAVAMIKSNAATHNVEILGQIEKLLLAFAGPKDFPAVRLSNGWSSFDTALASLYYRRAAEFARLTTPGIVADTTAFVFRDAARAFVCPTATGAFIYRATVPSILLTANPTPMRTGGLVGIGANLPHGPYLYPGVLEGSAREYYWLGSATDPTRGITITNNMAIGSVTAYLWMYDQGVATQVANGVAAAGGGTTVLIGTADAYYGVDLVGAASGSVTIEVKQTGAPVTIEWAHRALPFLEQNITSMDSFKIYAASLMYTNDASPLNRQGKIAGLQVPRGRSWTDFTTYTTLAQQSEAKSMSAENGIYGFLKPTQPEDFNFKDRDTVGTLAGVTGVRDIWYALRTDSDFLAVSANITTAAGQDGYWTPAWQFEYRTVDQWRHVDAADNTDDEVDAAIKLLAAVPQWYENPFHISDIMNWIGDKMNDAYDVAKRVLPGIVKAATTVASIGGAVIPLL